MHQQLLGVHAAAEGYAVSEIALQGNGVHPRRQGLYRVDGVHPQRDQIRDHVGNRAAGMVDHLQAVAFGLIHELFRAGKHKLPQMRGGEHQPRLRSEVVADQHRVQLPVGGLVENFVGAKIKLRNPVDHGAEHFRLGEHLDQRGFHAKRGAGVLKMAGPQHAQHGAVIHGLHGAAARLRMNILRRVGPIKIADRIRVLIVLKKARGGEGSFLIGAGAHFGKLQRAVNSAAVRKAAWQLHRNHVVLQLPPQGA